VECETLDAGCCYVVKYHDCHGGTENAQNVKRHCCVVFAIRYGMLVRKITSGGGEARRTFFQLGDPRTRLHVL